MRSSGTAYYLYCLTPWRVRHPRLRHRGGWANRPSWSAPAAELARFSARRSWKSSAANRPTRTYRIWLGWDLAFVAMKRLSRKLIAGSPCCRRVSRPFLLPWTACSGLFSNTGMPSPGSSLGSATNGSGPSRGCWIAPPGAQGPGSPGQPAADERAPAASPGARYFEEKRIQAQWERDFNLRLKEFCRRAAAALAEHAGMFPGTQSAGAGGGGNRRRGRIELGLPGFAGGLGRVSGTSGAAQ